METAIRERKVGEVPSQDAIAELRRTPDFLDCVGSSWPVHCHDFMVYVGPWEPGDVANVARERGIGAQELFNSMVDPAFKEFWPGEDQAWGNTALLVFRCTNCNYLEGILDYT